MAYIYKITNKINGKIYIGQTNLTVEKRFSEHIRASYLEKNKNRPLYIAFNQYGVSNFTLETVEETDNPNEREKYWINYFDSFNNGYNATKGGEGFSTLDYQSIYDLWIEHHKCGMLELSQLTGNDIHHLKAIIQTFGEPVMTFQETLRKNYGKKVNQYDKNFSLIQTFETIADAERSLGKKPYSTHIRDVCNGKRKTAFGYIWKWNLEKEKI